MTLESAARRHAATLAGQSQRSRQCAHLYKKEGHLSTAKSWFSDASDLALRAARLVEWARERAERYGRPSTPPACVVHFPKP